jgi:hypothetical protein
MGRTRKLPRERTTGIEPATLSLGSPSGAARLQAFRTVERNPGAGGGWGRVEQGYVWRAFWGAPPFCRTVSSLVGDGEDRVLFRDHSDEAPLVHPSRCCVVDDLDIEADAHWCGGRDKLADQVLAATLSPR